MQIGDLPRARVSAKRRAGSIFRVVLIVLAAGLSLTGWQALSSSQMDERPTQEVETGAGPGNEAVGLQAEVSPEQVLPPAVAVPSEPVAPETSVEAAPVAPAQPPSPAAELATAQADTTGAQAFAQVEAPVMEPVGAAQDAGQTELTPPQAVTPPQAKASALAAVTGAEDAGAAMAADPSESSAPVDLNTGSLEQLDSLDGGGPIGRAIIRARPYSSVEELVTKRVLRRSTYDSIKDQVTVR